MTESLTVNILCLSETNLVFEELIDDLQVSFGCTARVAMLIPNRHGSAIIALGSAHVLVMSEDKPLPFEVPRPDASPSHSGASPLLHHRTHVMVSLLNVPEDQPKKISSVLGLAQIVSSIANCVAASSAMWSSSGTLLPIKQFQDLTTRWTTSPDEVPTLLICRVLAYGDGVDSVGQARHGIFSVGLRSFMGQEIELVPQPLPVDVMTQNFDRVANHLLHSGRVLEDGDRILVPSIGQVETRFGAVRGGESGSLLLCDVDHGAARQGMYN